MANIMKKNNLLDACLNNNDNIFDEIKKKASEDNTDSSSNDGWGQ